MPDGRLGLAYRPERICVGQIDTAGPALLHDQLRLSGILRPVRGKESLL
jgi:hypothetical protein